jgi:hypothetical protein
MNPNASADDFVGVIGRYTIDLREVVHASGVVMLLAFGALWLSLNDGEHRVKVVEGVIAVPSSVVAVWYLLHRGLRTVVVDRESIVSSGPFGAFRQEIRIAEIRSIQFGGFSRGIDVDIEIGGKVIRLLTNRRFQQRLFDEMERVAKQKTEKT